MFDLLMLGGIFVSFFFVFFGLIHLVVFRKLIRGRLEKISGIHEYKEQAFQKFNYFLGGIIKCLGQFGFPKEEEWLSGTKTALSMAGYRRKNAPVLFFGLKIFLALLFLIITGGLVLCFTNLTNARSMICGLLAAGAGFYLPNLWIRLRSKKRIEQIRNGFPDLLDLLVVCMRAGQGLDAAMDRVGREINISNQVLGQEFRLLNLEIKAGKSRKEALRNLANRVGVDDISSLVTLINQSDELGVSVTKTLKVHSDIMRVKRQLRAEAMAAKIPIKLTVPLIFFILPCFMVVVVGPGLLKVVRALSAGLR